MLTKIRHMLHGMFSKRIAQVSYKNNLLFIKKKKNKTNPNPHKNEETKRGYNTMHVV